MDIITATGLIKSYHKTTVLKKIDLTIQAGEVIGYIGPNGAGKSTTIKILAGIIPDFEGDVKVLGYDIRKDALEVKRRIGYIPENAALYETLTPVEYLQFVGQLYDLDKAEADKRINELLELFDLAAAKNMRMSAFSKGMKQKVLLIGGLLHNPEIIFLDEPLSGLDANAVILVKEILLQLKRNGKTIFYSSHIMDVVEKLSDRIIIIQNGSIIANGSFAELTAAAHQGSLEEIFTELTGNQEHHSVAQQFINALGKRS